MDLAKLVSPQFVVTGHGWGHGVGLSQWGTYGYAKAGFTYKQDPRALLPAHDARAGDAPPRPRAARADAPSVVIASDDDMHVKDANGDSHTLAGGTYTPEARAQAPRRRPGQAAEAQRAAHLRGRLEPALAGRPGLSRPVRGLRRGWQAPGDQRGRARAVPVRSRPVRGAGRLACRGAQGAGGRRALVRALAPGRRRLRPLLRHAQPGVPGHRRGGRLTTAAVDATAGQVVLYNGKVASTYYFSTSGGRTAAIQDVWPGSPPVPYLVSVPDPYDKASPYHDWKPAAISPDKLAKVLKMQRPAPRRPHDHERVAARRADRRASGRNGTVGPRSTPPTSARRSACARRGSRSASSGSCSRPRRSLREAVLADRARARRRAASPSSSSRPGRRSGRPLAPSRLAATEWCRWR